MTAKQSAMTKSKTVNDGKYGGGKARLGDGWIGSEGGAKVFP